MGKEKERGRRGREGTAFLLLSFYNLTTDYSQYQSAATSKVVKRYCATLSGAISSSPAFAFFAAYSKPGTRPGLFHWGQDRTPRAGVEFL